MAILRLLRHQRQILDKNLDVVKASAFAYPSGSSQLQKNSRAILGWNYQLGDESRRVKSTHAPASIIADAAKTAAAAEPLPIRDTLDLTFNDARQAYRSKSTWEILRAYIVFKICSIEALVENNQKLMRLGHKILGKKLFEKIMEGTIYGHFVAGADQVTIQPNIQRLREFGVKAILDYSVEEDISQEEASKAEME